MFNLVKILALIPSLWRFARDMAKVMEETIPEDGYGSAKLRAVDAVLRTAIRVSDDTDDAAEEKLSALATGLTESAVALMKTTGELQAIAEQAKADVEEVITVGGIVPVADEASGD